MVFMNMWNWWPSRNIWRTETRAQGASNSLCDMGNRAQGRKRVRPSNSCHSALPLDSPRVSAHAKLSNTSFASIQQFNSRTIRLRTSLSRNHNLWRLPSDAKPAINNIQNIISGRYVARIVASVRSKSCCIRPTIQSKIGLRIGILRRNRYTNIEPEIAQDLTGIGFPCWRTSKAKSLWWLFKSTLSILSWISESICFSVVQIPSMVSDWSGSRALLLVATTCPERYRRSLNILAVCQSTPLNGPEIYDSESLKLL